jgi:hypothetical protein
MPGVTGDGMARAQDKSIDAIRAGRSAVADGLDAAASRVSAGGEHVNDAARATAGKMGNSARWLRDTSPGDMVSDFEAMVKKHPGRTVVGAIVLGFLAGRMFRGD